eukprot:COSAG01_NODE_14699_length_1420_cov_2.666919_1_plen_358_part_01
MRSRAGVYTQLPLASSKVSVVMRVEGGGGVVARSEWLTPSVLWSAAVATRPPPEAAQARRDEKLRQRQGRQERERQKRLRLERARAQRRAERAAEQQQEQAAAAEPGAGAMGPERQKRQKKQQQKEGEGTEEEEHAWVEYDGEGSAYPDAASFYRGWRMRPATDGDEPGIRRRLIFVSPNGEEFGAADSRHLDAQVDHLCRSLPLHAQVEVEQRLACGFIGGASFVTAHDPDDSSRLKVKALVGGPAQWVPMASISGLNPRAPKPRSWADAWPPPRFGVVSLARHWAKCLPSHERPPPPKRLKKSNKAVIRVGSAYQAKVPRCWPPPPPPPPSKQASPATAPPPTVLAPAAAAAAAAA